MPVQDPLVQAIVSALPNLPVPEVKELTYLPYSEKTYKAIVWPNGFTIGYDLAGMAMDFSPGLWPVRLKLEYDAYVAGHKPDMTAE